MPAHYHRGARRLDEDRRGTPGDQPGYRRVELRDNWLGQVVRGLPAQKLSYAQRHEPFVCLTLEPRGIETDYLVQREYWKV